MKFAAVDIGNTTAKVFIWEGERHFWSHGMKDCAEALAYCRDTGVYKVAYCSTRSIPANQKKMLENEGWWEFRYGCLLPISIDYKTPEKLGLDRIAAAVGANTLYPGCDILIADIGTALTLDVVSRDGRFIGGNICPGVQMRLDAMHKFTSNLPDVDIEGYTGNFGYDTATAMRNGAVSGVVNDVACTFLRARDTYGCGLLLATGGGAKYLQSPVRRLTEQIAGGEVSMKYEPWLVFEGLKKIYEYNHE